MIYKLKDIVQKKDGLLRGPFGSALKKSVFVPEDTDTYKVYEQCVPLEQNENLGNYYISKEYYETNVRRFNVLPKDFLVSCSGVNYGAIYQLSNKAKPGVINQALLRIRLNNEIIDDDYFLYLFKSLIYKKITKGTGDSTIPNFPSMEIVKNIEFDIPDICLQKRISSFFKKIDIKINANNEVNNLLESLAKTLYDYWFLQFEFPNEEGKPYKSSGGKMVWNEELKREIPEGWEVKELQNICDVTMGQSPKSELYNSDCDGYPLINGAVELNKNGIFINKYTKEASRLSNKGDWLFCIRATIGNVQKTDQCYALGRGVAGASPKEDRYSEYLFMLINEMCDHFSKTLIGSIISGMTKDDILAYKILVPKENILQKFHAILNPCFESKEKNKKQNQQLSSLRDWLLPMLVNGQVTFEKKKDAA